MALLRAFLKQFYCTPTNTGEREGDQKGKAQAEKEDLKRLRYPLTDDWISEPIQYTIPCNDNCSKLIKTTPSSFAIIGKQ